MITGSQTAELYELFETADALAQVAAVMGGRDNVLAYMKARQDFRRALLAVTEQPAPLLSAFPESAIPLGATP